MEQFAVRSVILSCFAIALAGCSSTRICEKSPAAVTEKSSDQVNPALPRIPAGIFNLQDFGGVGDGKTWNTEAFEKAIAEVNRKGGGHLVVPAGVFRTRPFTLCSQLDLHLDDGAVIQASESFADDGLPDPTTLKTQGDVQRNVKKQIPLISGEDLHDVAITGDGIIDGGGGHWWVWSERAARAMPGRIFIPRPKLVVIHRCERLHLDGITLRNSPQFHLAPYDVSDLLIEHVKIQSPHDAPNTDAIDPSACTNVLIRDCDLDVGDDDVAIKGAGLVNHVLIEDCRIKHGHGISIGSETNGGVRNMLVRRCTLEGTDNGIRIKSMRGAGGLVENIHFTELQMKNVTDAIVLDLLYVDNNRPNFRGIPSEIPKIKNVEIDHLDIENAHDVGKIVGLPDSPIMGVNLHDLKISAENDLILENVDHLEIERVSLTIRSGKAPGANGSSTKPTTRPTSRP